ncbi:hypothetical protein EON65_22920 [archaeon]|nr:MAG: hypothetical protein EON65_22920 [archaeon]
MNAFKKLVHTYGGQKSLEVKSKIASVWYFNTEQGLTSYLVNEFELVNFLNSTAFEIIAIQVYIGGYCVKGNGIFEHRVNKLTMNGTIKYQTLENCDVTDSRFAPLQYTLRSKHLIILEHQHELLKALGGMVIRHIEYISRAKVSQISFQAIFNSTWTPFIVSLKSITFTEAPNNFFESREEAIYPFNKPPSVPTMHERSPLLPIGGESAQNMDHVFRQKKRNQQTKKAIRY